MQNGNNTHAVSSPALCSASSMVMCSKSLWCSTLQPNNPKDPVTADPVLSRPISNLFPETPKLLRDPKDLSVHTQDGDEGVALESCEFWTAFCEAKVQPSTLRPFLGRLVPVLLKNMVYDEYDEEVSLQRSCCA